MSSISSLTLSHSQHGLESIQTDQISRSISKSKSKFKTFAQCPWLFEDVFIATGGFSVSRLPIGFMFDVWLQYQRMPDYDRNQELYVLSSKVLNKVHDIAPESFWLTIDHFKTADKRAFYVLLSIESRRRLFRSGCELPEKLQEMVLDY